MQIVSSHLHSAFWKGQLKQLRTFLEKVDFRELSPLQNCQTFHGGNMDIFWNQTFLIEMLTKLNLMPLNQALSSWALQN